MPRIKDLGINVVPGTMRPPEIGGGGGGCRWSMRMDCTNCTPDTGPGGISDDGCACITADQCHRYTCRAMTCGWQTEKMDTNPDCQCITIPNRTEDTCQCISAAWQGHPCRLSGCGVTHPANVTPHTPRLAPGALSRDQIGALRAQLRNHLENLDHAEKNLLPKSVEEVDAREQELQRELEMLKKRRDELKK